MHMSYGTFYKCIFFRPLNTVDYYSMLYIATANALQLSFRLRTTDSCTFLLKNFNKHSLLLQIAILLMATKMMLRWSALFYLCGSVVLIIVKLK